MSADNWTVCPVCKNDTTLREDYEQGMTEDGNYYLDYSCSCQFCAFKWGVKLDRQLLRSELREGVQTKLTSL